MKARTRTVPLAPGGTAWMVRGACAGRPEWTDPADQEQAQEARQACQLCPVLPECTRYAQRLTWSGGVVIAAWIAPATNPRPRPVNGRRGTRTDGPDRP